MLLLFLHEWIKQRPVFHISETLLTSQGQKPQNKSYIAISLPPKL